MRSLSVHEGRRSGEKGFAFFHSLDSFVLKMVAGDRQTGSSSEMHFYEESFPLVVLPP